MSSNGNGPVSTLKIGTRDSALAMKQTTHVKDTLCQLYPNLLCTVDSMKTIGDKKLDVALSKIGSKSLFTKELEDALGSQQVHIVVHSLKDLPTQLPPGMVIGAILKREDPRDAVILHPQYKNKKLTDLPEGSVLGSSSVRRVAQLKRHFPHLKCESVRGNLNTRLRKLEEGQQYAGLVLAAAGINRMGWTDKVGLYLEADQCLHAVGQGALAVECLENDSVTQKLLQSLCHGPTLLAVIAERTLMAALEGGCSAPVAASAHVEGTTIKLKGGVWSLDGSVELLESMERSLPEYEKPSNFCPHSGFKSSDSNGNDPSDPCDISKLAGAKRCPVLEGLNNRQSVSFVGGIEGCPVMRSLACSQGLTPKATDHPDVNAYLPPSHYCLIQQREEEDKNGSVKGSACKRGSGDDQEHPCKRLRSISQSSEGNSDLKVYAGIVPPRYLEKAAAVALQLGKELSEALLKRGAAKILAEAKIQNTMSAPNTKPVPQTTVDSSKETEKAPNN